MVTILSLLIAISKVILFKLKEIGTIFLCWSWKITKALWFEVMPRELKGQEKIELLEQIIKANIEERNRILLETSPSPRLWSLSEFSSTSVSVDEHPNEIDTTPPTS